jgi:hypothetical protein
MSGSRSRLVSKARWIVIEGRSRPRSSARSRCQVRVQVEVMMPGRDQAIRQRKDERRTRLLLGLDAGLGSQDGHGSQTNNEEQASNQPRSNTGLRIKSRMVNEEQDASTGA